MSDELTKTHENPSNNNGENGKKLERVKWKNRRRMAWVALVAMLCLMCILLFGSISVERIAALKEPITWFFFSMASIIGAYMGFTTWASRK